MEFVLSGKVVKRLRETARRIFVNKAKNELGTFIRKHKIKVKQSK